MNDSSETRRAVQTLLQLRGRVAGRPTRVSQADSCWAASEGVAP